MGDLREKRLIGRAIEDVGPGWLAAFMIATIAFGLVTGISAISSSQISTNSNLARGSRVQLMQTLNGLPGDQRKVQADAILFAHANDITSPIDEEVYGRVTENDIISALQSTAKTGEPLVLTNKSYHWYAFRQVLFWTGVSAFGLYMLIAFFVYAYQILEERPNRWGNGKHFYIIDLPWKHVWPVLFVATTPIGWPFYAVSALRLRHKLNSGVERNPEVAQVAENLGYYLQDDFYPLRDVFDRMPTASKKPIKFEADPEAAQAQYLRVRTELWHKATIRRKEALTRKVGESQIQLKAHGMTMQELQVEYNRDRAELRELEAIDVSDTSGLDLDAIASEFELLTKFKGVKSVRVVGDAISMLVEARIDYEGTTYDLSDWELRFDATGLLYSQEVRSGARSGGHYPPYVMGDNSFCFGHLDRTIKENLLQGQFLQGMEIAVNCLHSVNKDHQHRISSYLKVVKTS